MTESQYSCDPYAAKRGVGFNSHAGWRWANEAVKEPAAQKQLRIRWRHLERNPSASKKIIWVRRTRAPRHLPATQIVRREIPVDSQERFGLAELQPFLPSFGG